MRRIHIKISKILALSLAVGMAAGIAGCGADEKKAAAESASELTDLANTESENQDAGGEVTKIKVAFEQGYKPYDFVDDTGNADGYEVAVLKAVDERLAEYEFEFVPTTNDDLLIGVQSGKYDAGIKGVWWTKEREENYVFPEHYIGSSTIGITFRKENEGEIKDLESFAKFSGALVPIAPQNAQYAIVENYNKSHPDAQINLIPSDQFDLADAYQWVVEGRYDAFFNIKTSYLANVVAEDGEYHQYADRLSYVEYESIPTWVLFNKDSTELAEAYDGVWEQLQTEGILEELAEKYFGYSLFDGIPEGYQKGDDL